MKNFVQPGVYGLPVIAPANVNSGAVVIVGKIIGVASCTVLAGAEVEIAVEGVYDLAKVPADVHALGDVAKIDATGVVSLAGTTAIGWIVAAAAAGSTTARVRLTPGTGDLPVAPGVDSVKHGDAKHEHAAKH